MRFEYKKQFSFEQRKTEATAIRRKYPDRIPVILERNPRSRMGTLTRRKFLVPAELPVGQFHHLIWKSQSDSRSGFWLFLNNVIPPATVTMGWLYEEYHDDDFFLYIACADENVFGQ